MAGIYIHIPFCESRCIYCDFYSTTSLKWKDDYVDALCKEMELRPAIQALGDNYPIKTIYLGGGTPSQLSDGHLLQIFTKLKETYGDLFSKNMEITMECNPDDVTPDFCKTLGKLPVNRVSMGAQTFSDQRLQFLRRRHNTAEVKEAVSLLRKTGIENISIDLMFGFPKENIEDWKYDILQALQLGVEHISAYSLMYEEGTPLYKMLEQGKIEEIDEELSRNMYDTLVDMLTLSGYEHYEISNFAKPGYRSRHNSSYWNETPYIGLGAAAHSYRRARNQSGKMEVTRSWNINNIQQYINSIHQGILPSEKEHLGLATRYNDLITTALRTSDGIDLEKTEKEFGKCYLEKLLDEANDKIKRGFMKIDKQNDRLSLTREGIYISDDIMGDFMIV